MRLLLIYITALSLISCSTSRVMKVHPDLGESAVSIAPIYINKNDITLVNFKDIKIDQPLELDISTKTKGGVLYKKDSIIKNYNTRIHLLHREGGAAMVEIQSRDIDAYKSETLLKKVANGSRDPWPDKPPAVLGKKEKGRLFYTSRSVRSISIKTPDQKEWLMNLYQPTGEKINNLFLVNGADSIKLYLVRPKDGNYYHPIGYELEKDKRIIATVQNGYGNKRLWYKQGTDSNMEIVFSALAICIWNYGL